MEKKKTFALIAHTNKKPQLLEWVQHNRQYLSRSNLCATGTTGKILKEISGLEIIRYQSGYQTY